MSLSIDFFCSSAIIIEKKNTLHPGKAHKKGGFLMEIKFTKASQLKEKPDFNKLGFGKYVTDYMFVMDYDHEQGWHDPQIVP